MNYFKLTAVFIAVFFALSGGCATVSAPAAPDELDIAIRDASDYLNDNIPKGSKIVILNMQSDTAALSDYIIDELISNAVNDRIFTVVDRAQLDLIRTEQNIQHSGEVDDKDALAIGKFFGAQYIVSGAVSELGERYRMRIRALNVQTSQVQGQYNRNIAAGKTITALMKNKSGGSPAASSSGRTAAASAAERQTTQAAAQPRGAANGTYTLWPRPRATQGGIATNFYIAQIVVSNDYIIFYFARTGQGDFSNGHNGFWEAGQFTLQDLDNPSRFYKPALDRRTSNGMGTIWLISFNRFPATRFKLYTERGGYPYSDNIQIIWDEIVLGEPDK